MRSRSLSTVDDVLPMIDGTEGSGRRPIFVVGCPRSGTTLVRNQISSHVDAALLPFETHLLDRWDSRFKTLDLSTAADFGRFWDEFSRQPGFDRCGFDRDELVSRLRAPEERPTARSILTTIMETYADLQGKSRSGEKTPDHFAYIATLFDWFPNASVVFVLRDPRAVMASWRMLDRPWTRVSARSIVALWRESTDEAHRWLAERRIHTVRYEDLVAEPETQIGALFGFLGLDSSAAAAASARGGEHHGRFEPAGPIRADEPDRWRQVLLPAEIRLIESTVGREMERSGYRTVGRVSPRETSQAVATRVRGRVRRDWRAGRRLAARALRGTQ